MKWLAIAFGLLCLGSCSKSRSPEAGSQTHFLSECDDHCANPFSCVCGVCTLPCAETAQCGQASAAASCVGPVGDGDRCSAQSEVCDVECRRDGDCMVIGEWFSCEQGRCRQAAQAASSDSGGARSTHDSGTRAQVGRAGDAGVREPDSSAVDAGGVTIDDTSLDMSIGCTTSTDCVLYVSGCCVCSPVPKELYSAAPRGARVNPTNCMGVFCGSCTPEAYDPTAAVVRAACIAGECTVVDLRADPVTACQSDDDCKLASVGCCGSCGANPFDWIALRTGAEDPYPVSTCDPAPPCEPCSDPDRPHPVCEADGHCAVREVPTVDGVPSATCFSPIENTDKVSDADAVGCDCAASGATACIEDTAGHRVLIDCDKHWSVSDSGFPCR